MDKKKYAAIGLAIVMMFSLLVPIKNITLSATMKGQGTEQSPDLIKAVEDLSHIESQIVIGLGEKRQLSVDSDLSENKDMIWTVTGGAISANIPETVSGSAITVDAMGVVTGLNIGTGIVMVEDRYSDYAQTINVRVVENISDYQLAMDMKVGEKSKVTISDHAMEDSVTWTVSGSAIAVSTSNSGRVKALQPGVGVVKALDPSGNVVGKVYIRVRENE